MKPIDFLNLLWKNKPNEYFVLIWILKDRISNWFSDISAAAELVDGTKGDVYVGVGLSKHDYGKKQRCVSDEIAGIAGVWADIDIRSEAHSQSTLPGTVEEGLSILPPEFPPTLVVLTGNGIHVWWLFREPWMFASDDERRQAGALVEQWQTLLRDSASQRGWKCERLADLARVLRVPGTTNCKDPANPKPVTIHSQIDLRYNPSEIAEYLEDLGVPDSKAEALVAREWTERFKDKPLTIDLATQIPEEMLNGWLETDSRFKNTWFRQRPDLHDQSQSGYDLALACFGFRTGLEEQQVVDLMVQHRSMHKQKPRTRLDYFQRTLARAAQSGDGTPTGGGDLGNPPAAGSDSALADATVPASGSRSKASICRKISEALGIELLRIVKVSGSHPFYRMETVEGKIEFDDVGKLISQRAVRMAVAATAGKLIRHFKPKVWEEIAQSMLDACIVMEGGEELDQEGAARMYIGQYLADTTFILSLEGQAVQDIRRPMVRDNRITVCASSLQNYINKTTQQNLSVRAVAAMLSAIGATTVRVRGKKIKDQSRWELSPYDFDPGDYSVPGSPYPVAQHE